MSKKTVTIKQAADAYIEHLKELGKNERTIVTYGRHLEFAIAHFGENRDIGKILPVHVSTFFKSDAVNKLIREPKKEGEQPRERARSQHTVSQTLRVTRQMLVFCKEQKMLDKIPLPKAEAVKIKEKGDSELPEPADQTATQGE